MLSWIIDVLLSLCALFFTLAMVAGCLKGLAQFWAGDPPEQPPEPEPEPSRVIDLDNGNESLLITGLSPDHLEHCSALIEGMKNSTNDLLEDTNP